MVIGYDRPLYILPLDQRASFQTKRFGWQGSLTAAQTERLPTHPADRIDELLPDAWLETHPQARRKVAS
jgi:hypothetical protein